MSEQEGRAAYRANERRSDVLLNLADIAKDAAGAAHAQEENGQPAESARDSLSFVFLLLMRGAMRLVALSVRVWTGRGFPRPRAPGEAPRPGRDPEAAAPRERAAGWGRPRFADLFALGVPEAEALRDRLAALLADPEAAGLIAAEPAVWGAAAPIARALGLRLPPRPEAREAAAPAGPKPAKPAARPRKPAPEGWFDYKPGLGPLVLPFDLPEAEADPPPWLRPRPRPESLRSRLLRSAIGWA